MMELGHNASVSIWDGSQWTALPGTVEIKSIESESLGETPEAGPFACEYSFEMIGEPLSEEVIEAIADALRRYQFQDAITAPVLVKPALRV